MGDSLIVIERPGKSECDPLHLPRFGKMPGDNLGELVEGVKLTSLTFDLVNMHAAHNLLAICYQGALDGTPAYIECEYEWAAHRYSPGSCQFGFRKALMTFAAELPSLISR